MNRFGYALLLTLSIAGSAGAEAFRTIVAGKLAVAADQPEGSTLSLSYVDSVVLEVVGDQRFLRGVELELRVPQVYLKYRGSVAVSLYAPLKTVPADGVADLNAERVGFEPIQNKLQAIYHIPVRRNHGLKVSPYVSMPTGIVPLASFPMLVRFMPVIKGLPEDFETIRFQLSAKPILSDEGALRIALRYPEKLKDRPFTLLIDDAVVDAPGKEMILTEGEHALTLVSDHYRNETRRFVVERAKTTELLLELQDPTPLVTIEAPGNAQVFFDGEAVASPREPFPVEPGEHEVRFVVGDYSVVKPIAVRKGRTYRVSLSIDVTVSESD